MLIVGGGPVTLSAASLTPNLPRRIPPYRFTSSACFTPSGRNSTPSRMSTRVYGWDQNPIVDQRLYRCSNSSAAEALRKGEAVAIIDGEGRRAIQLCERVEFSLPEAAKLGYVVSPDWYLRVIKTRSEGDKLHYEIPMAGDRGSFARHRPSNYFAGRVCAEECPCHRQIPA
jgi:hypothetical protein